jgi:threonine/homoserine/homoserine lactone efflux protein
VNLHTWWLFVGMTFVVSATPGPNMLLVMSNSARFGVRAAIVSMAGCMTSILTMMGVSAAGLGALLHAFPAVFDTLRLAGAAYLAYLGVACWRSSVQDTTAVTDSAPVASYNAWALYRRGAMVAASNPKAMLFAAAFFPQFINPASPQLPQFSILLATFTVIEVSWYFVYAVSGVKLSNYLRRASVMRLFNRVTGGVFVGFAAVMALVRE